ncbi:GerAB/ArcD/ProY family transporter [Cohnella luojiensis]|uniref:Spore gernimation protein GerB n=1 Tax=Cohnella luojiensis TaxID=652876 RepID=A0A4Y8M3R6_9BACL|nr:GerAB/ArcD/ProY family transporter [Cohnella luojiensis]TFE27479.1 spore gernimation protein GerB [Cohnella luojiensis]
MAGKIGEKSLLSPFMAFFAAHCMQLGIGHLTFQSDVAKLVGQDSWIVVCLTGIMFHLVIWMMYRVLNKAQNDIISINQAFFGRWAGNVLNLFFLGYFLLFGGTTLRTFIYVVQVWLFPDVQTWILSLILLLLACYAVFGGLRTVIGVCLFSLIHYVLLPLHLELVPYLHFNNLLPAMDHSTSEMIRATQKMTFSFLGLEILMIYYPWFKQPQKSERWVHLANAATTLFYLIEIAASLTFFSKDQLVRVQWPTLALFQFFRLPYIERFEFIVVTFNLLRAVPILCLCLWSASRIAKTITRIRPSRTVPFFAALLAIFAILLPDYSAINQVHQWGNLMGNGLVYGYIPLMFVLSMIAKKVKPA